jgi:1,4-dihydroxy-6-naphthoate synthase
MFRAIADGSLGLDGLGIEVQLHDVETLNESALRGRYDVSKVSFAAYLEARPNYALLDAGAALGYGCGPLVVARDDCLPDAFSRATVALPGRLTTAHLLFRLWRPEFGRSVFTRYDEVMAMLLTGRADVGVIIHESRFLAADAGLQVVADLGAWWEEETGLPVPLGGIVARRSLGPDMIARIEEMIRLSIARSRMEPGRTWPYVRQHAAEISQDVLDKHVETFVNEFSVSLGSRGRASVEKLEEMAVAAGVVR